MRERESARERARAREREREREREIERERERERERDRPNTKIKNQAKKITPTIFPFVDSGPISLGFHGNLPQEIVVLRRREKEREIERERERERERRRERDGESTLQDHIIYNEMRIALHTCLPDIFLVC